MSARKKNSSLEQDPSSGQELFAVAGAEADAEPKAKSGRPRLSRAERREQQREASPARALKMRAARLAAHPEWTAPAPELPRLLIGCSGWFYWHWKGSYYPEDLPVSQWFPRYSADFDTVELNAPFYSWPTVALVKGWLRQVGGKPFVYAVKVSELITHVKQFRDTKTLVKDFGYIADLLGPRMGCFLFQLPPSFDYSAARLRNLVTQLEPERRNVVEFRHRSWWQPRVYDAFRDHGIIFCSCSAPNLPDELVPTAPEVYLRFHGKEGWYRHHYSGEELAVWHQRIRDSGCQRVWAYFNNDWEAHAITNGRQFREMLAADPALFEKEL